MKTNLSYNSAFSVLEKLVEQMESDEIQIDELAEKVKQANELISFCEKKLRTVEKEVKKTIDN
ncbi:MAG: exodeoxyribonuclease VII small subunit [Chitinophagaceae bacterium]|nr:exodeoxyribonuclease VII small subunit [Chitinophagaceae bacterium]